MVQSTPEQRKDGMARPPLATSMSLNVPATPLNHKCNPNTPATAATTPFSRTAPDAVSDEARALFRDDTPPRVIFQDAIDWASPIQRRRRKSSTLERRKKTRKVPTPSSTPSTSSSSEADTSPDPAIARRRISAIDGEKKGPVHFRMSRINAHALVVLLCIVTLLSCAVTYSSFPAEPKMDGVPRYELLERVTAPSAGGLRGKMVQMAGRKDYWKQRDAHARHDELPKSRKAKASMLTLTSKKPRALQFTPPPPLGAAKPYALDEKYYIDVDAKAFSPRVMSFGSTSHHKHVEVFPAEFTDNTQYYGLYDSDDERLNQMEVREPYANDECVPMQDWQVTYHPSCNGMHETALENMGLHAENDAHLFGTKGYWRNAWRLDLLGGHHHLEDREKIVLKTLKFQHNFEDAHFEHDRVDAVAMERLTSSPHVVNIFGFCGHSVMTEFADGSRVGELADKSRKKKLAVLQIARDIAHGLADVHGIDGDGNATFVHLDINPANVVSIGGTLKLNDFNIGIILKWNTTSNKQCGFPAQYPNPQWRSPEEARGEQFLTEKVDVFSMGHIFFRLICGHEPWNKLEIGGKPSKEEIHEKVQKGVLPVLPDDVMNTDNAEIAVIRDVMLQCYTFDPAERPSARSIAIELDDALIKLSAELAAEERHTKPKAHVGRHKL